VGTSAHPFFSKKQIKHKDMSCNQTIAGIARDCAPSMGGIKRAWIANYDDVAAVTESTDKVSGLTMESGKTFKEFAFRKGTSSFTSTLNVDPANGVSYVSTEINLVFSKMETTKRVELAALAVGELAVIVEDMNGVLWYFGKDEAVVASAGDGQTGVARTDRNGYSITLMDNALSFPLEATADALDDALGN
jgi:hypothetical protein